MPEGLSVDGARLLADLKALARFGALPAGGLDRPPFSEPYREAAAWLVSRMAEAGLEVRTDVAGNIFGRLGPPEGPAVLTGSHIDTVPSGGWLDGALGVMASLECARVLRESGRPLAKALEVCSFTDEEGSYVSLLGSRAVTGALPVEELSRSAGRGGELASDAMRRFGLDPGATGKAKRGSSDVAAYVEIHIEQGPVLAAEQKDIGIVTVIVGIETLRFTFKGAARHAGTTPLEARKDAFRGVAAAVAEVYDRATSGDWGEEVRVNFGAVEVLPGASNVVPSTVRLTCEIRGTTLERMRDVRTRVERCLSASAERFGLSLDCTPLSHDPPAAMSEELGRLIERSATGFGLTSRRLPSGAGHDAQAFAAIAPSAMLFIPSPNGISHHPDEFSTDDQIVRGANVLLRTLADLVGAA
ncbi:MAG: Zn-dependent hydrolase [Parvibaculaceae bacterium]